MDDNLYFNLLALLKEFKNRPYHLAKYLIDNEALSDKFIKKICESEELNIRNERSNNNSIPHYFLDIAHMTDYFNSFMDGSQPKVKSVMSITRELNSKLDQCLKEDKYEDAIRIRDYMIKHNIKRIN